VGGCQKVEIVEIVEIVKKLRKSWMRRDYRSYMNQSIVTAPLGLVNYRIYSRKIITSWNIIIWHFLIVIIISLYILFIL
jgi:hypothetical protein